MKNQTIENKLSNIIIALISAFTLIAVLYYTIRALFPSIWLPSMSTELPTKEQFLILCLFSPLVEEVIFRYIPLQILKRIPFFEEIQWYLVALIAIVFGLMHGHMNNIFVQGVAGFFFGWVYIKNSFSYWSAVTTHLLYNIVTVVIIPILI